MRKNGFARGIWVASLSVCLVVAAEAGAIETLNVPPREMDHEKPHKGAAVITDRSRNETYNDFLRVLWVQHGTTVDRIALGKRSFFTASTFFMPPVTVDTMLRFVGNFYRVGQDFVVMRCKPSPEQRDIVKPILASWPNTFAAIESDLAGPYDDCSTSGLTEGEKQICRIAVRYRDQVGTVYTRGLAKTLRFGAQMFATDESTAALKDDYGIFPAFTGLGFTVQASAAPVTGATVPMTTAEVLRNSVVPEYLLSKALLSEGGCRCVQVPESAALHQELVDPDFVWHFGVLDNGKCRNVPSLPTGYSSLR